MAPNYPFTPDEVKCYSDPLRFDEVMEQNVLGRVGLADADTNFDVFCYKRPSGNRINKANATRGAIFDKKGNLLIQGMPYTPDYNSRYFRYDDLDDITNKLFVASVEGAMIRVFHCSMNGKIENESTASGWYIASVRKLDAFKSRWNSPRSYGEQFWRAVFLQGDDADAPDDEVMREQLAARFEDTLDKQLMHTFVVSPDHLNRVVLPSTPPLVCSGPAFDVFNKMHFETVDFADTLIIPGINRVEELKAYVNRSFDEGRQGVMVFDRDNITPPYKIFPDDYHRLYHLRGAVQSPLAGFVPNICNIGAKIAYRGLYPRSQYKDLNKKFDEYENAASSIVYNMVRVYKVRRNFVSTGETNRPGVPPGHIAAFKRMSNEIRKKKIITHGGMVGAAYRSLGGLKTSVLNTIIKAQCEYIAAATKEKSSPPSSGTDEDLFE